MSHRRALGLVLGLLLVAGCAGCASSSDESPAEDEAAPTTSSSTEPPIEPIVRSVGTTTGTMELDGLERTYRLHVPEDLGDDPAPLLVALHGGGGSAEQYAAASGFDDVADEEGFVVVYPDGSGTGQFGDNLRTWNAGTCCGPAERDDIDDVGFVSALIDEIVQTQGVDPAQVVLAGHSNGSTMSYRLACELGDRVVAIGVQSAPLTYQDCVPDGSVGVLHIHGGQDRNVPIAGGQGTEGISGEDWPPVRDGVQLFADVNGCSALVENDPVDGVSRTTWDDCDDGATVVLVVVADGPHGWMRPGGDGGRGEATDVGFDSSAEIWAFLSGQLDR